MSFQESAPAQALIINNLRQKQMIQIQGIAGGYPGTQAFLAKLRSLELIEEGNVGTGYAWVRPVAGKRGEIEAIVNEFGGEIFEGLSTLEAATSQHWTR